MSAVRKSLPDNAYLFPKTPFLEEKKNDPYKYHSGFGSAFESEAKEGAIPHGQNNPQKCPLGLYAEQLSGTAFTVPRANNQRSWLYRCQPSVTRSGYLPAIGPNENKLFTNDFSKTTPNPNQLRWLPVELKGYEALDFVQGIRTIGGAGDIATKAGIAIHLFACGSSMKDKSFYNSDGDFLIVPQEGTLDVVTEFGKLQVVPTEIIVIPRGVNFAVNVSKPSRGYILEIYNGHFKIPDLGPIGANGLANPRDFLAPTAAYESRKCNFTVISKFLGKLFQAEQDHSVFDVVGWTGNYYPFKYDLDKFNTINSVSYDHPDPSIFTVLTCQTTEVGTAAADFVIFPERYMNAEHTFRPPYYHRNCMSEYMGMIHGVYDAKEGQSKSSGFFPGGGSLHSCMTPHGPDSTSFEKASNAELKPFRMDSTLAFMFESCYLLNLTDWAQETNLDEDYQKCWQQLKSKLD